MHAVIIDPAVEGRYRTADMDVPRPERGEALLQMLSATLNYRDFLIRSQPVSPYSGDARGRIAGSDGVGVVSQVGPEVVGIDVGGRYMPSFFPDWIDGPPTPTKVARHLGGSAPGVMAEQMVARAASLVAVPEHLSNDQAAALPCAGVTAWAALVMYGGAKAGQTILVQGTGGVSIFALQIARILGLRIIATSSSDAKLDRARAMGADVAINYRTNTDWAAAVLDTTNGLGVDHLIDVGGEATMGQSLRAIAMGGHLSLVGVLAGFGGTLDGMALRGRALHVHTVFVESRLALQQLATFCDTHRMQPVIDKCFAMADVNEAVDAMLAGAHFGKIAIQIES